MKLTKRIQAHLKSRGIEVRKGPASPYQPIPLFRLAVANVMATIDRPVRFIQVGANDGLYSDPLRHYVLNHGWRGILVEPQPDVFDRLRHNYRDQTDRLHFENVAIASKPGHLELFRVPNGGIGADGVVEHALTVTSADPETVASQTGVDRGALVQIRVPTVRLDALIEKHGFDDFDILQIDVEGFERSVFESIDLARHRPKLIQFEHGHLGRPDIEEIIQILDGARYRIHFGGHELDSLAISQEFLRQADLTFD
jgi:FkbM family methyltransferase